MSKTVFNEGDEGVRLIVKDAKLDKHEQRQGRSPVHVVYGGAHLFSADTPAKLGRLALRAMDEYAPNFLEFAAAMRLRDRAELPNNADAVTSLQERLERDEGQVKREYFPAWFAWTVYRRVAAKLGSEPVEDYRIDFEDGYGFRSDDEEDSHSLAAAEQLANSYIDGTITSYSGFRIKGLAPETCSRAVRTLEVFLSRFLSLTDSRIPQNFIVTLPKVSSRKEVEKLAALLKRIEKSRGLQKGSIGIEIMVETPNAIIDRKGRFALPGIVKAAKGRCASAHFGAYDYTSALGVSAAFQDIRHNACDFARQLMLTTLAPLDVRLVDSVTTEIPVPVHRGGELSPEQTAENRRAVHAAWRKHFNNVRRSMSEGFYQSWDIHPNQLPARFAAVYSFFLESKEPQAARLRGFIETATRANMTGGTFDDAASAQGLLNFFVQGISCGAFTAGEVESSTGLSIAEIDSRSFSTIMSARQVI